MSTNTSQLKKYINDGIEIIKDPDESNVVKLFIIVMVPSSLIAGVLMANCVKQLTAIKISGSLFVVVVFG
jgi:hypothetical protein